jgi:hypothetical protein
MDKEQALRDTTEKLISFIGMPEEYIPEYFDDIMNEIELAFRNGEQPDSFTESFISNFMDGIDFGENDYGDVVDEIIDIYERGYEEYTSESAESLFEDTRRDYNAKYAGASNGPFDEIYKTAQGPGTTSAEKKAAVTSKHFKKDDAGWGPIPTTGVGRSDYNVKYSRSGGLLEAKAPRKPGTISPALKEALAKWENRKRLIESKVLDFQDLDLLDD